MVWLIWFFMKLSTSVVRAIHELFFGRDSYQMILSYSFGKLAFNNSRHEAELIYHRSLKKRPIPYSYSRPIVTLPLQTSYFKKPSKMVGVQLPAPFLSFRAGLYLNQSAQEFAAEIHPQQSDETVLALLDDVDRMSQDHVAVLERYLQSNPKPTPSSSSNSSPRRTPTQQELALQCLAAHEDIRRWLNSIRPLVEFIKTDLAPRFDFREVKGNGYRSLLRVFALLLDQIQLHARHALTSPRLSSALSLSGPQSWLASWVPSGQQRLPASFSNLQLLRGWNKNSRVAQWFDSLRALPSGSEAATGSAVRYSELKKNEGADSGFGLAAPPVDSGYLPLVPATNAAENVAINQGALEFLVDYVRAMREFAELLALSAALPAFADGFYERVSDCDARIPTTRARLPGAKLSLEREASALSTASSNDSFASASSMPATPSPLHEPHPPAVLFRLGAPTASGAPASASAQTYAAHESLFVRPDLLRDERFTALLSHALRLDMGALQGKCLGFQYHSGGFLQMHYALRMTHSILAAMWERRLERLRNGDRSTKNGSTSGGRSTARSRTQSTSLNASPSASRLFWIRAPASRARSQSPPAPSAQAHSTRAEADGTVDDDKLPLSSPANQPSASSNEVQVENLPTEKAVEAVEVEDAENASGPSLQERFPALATLSSRPGKLGHFVRGAMSRVDPLLKRLPKNSWMSGGEQEPSTCDTPSTDQHPSNSTTEPSSFASPSRPKAPSAFAFRLMSPSKKSTSAATASSTAAAAASASASPKRELKARANSPSAADAEAKPAIAPVAATPVDEMGAMDLARCFIYSLPYWYNDDLRAQKMCDALRNADIRFLSLFWNLSEQPHVRNVMRLFSHYLAVNELFTLEVAAESGARRAIGLRVLSRHYRVGQERIIKSTFARYWASSGLALNPSKKAVNTNVRAIEQAAEPATSDRAADCAKDAAAASSAKAQSAPARSPNLLFHIHGGGFVAQTSASHECYLRQFAVRLDCPILSVDYTLSPSPFGGQHVGRASSWESGYSNALDDVFHAYKWALNTLTSSTPADGAAEEQLRDCLGWSGERVVLLGDSAGGNLCLALALRCIAEGVRVPDGLVLAYTCSLVSIAPSPSRLLTMFDPLLPAPALSKCLTAYLGLDNVVRALPGDRELVDGAQLTNARRAREEAADLERIHVHDRSIRDWFALFEGLRGLSRCNAQSAAESAAAGATDAAQQPRWFELLRKYSTFSLSAKAPDSTASTNTEKLDDASSGAKSDKLFAEDAPQHVPTNSTLASGVRCKSDPSLSSSYLEACELELRLAGAATRSLDLESLTESPDADKRAREAGEKERMEDVIDSADMVTRGEIESEHLDFTDWRISPLLAPDLLISQLPPLYFISSIADPLLDDSIDMARRIDAYNTRVRESVGGGGREVFVHVEVLQSGVPHGFLNLQQLDTTCRAACDRVLETLVRAFELD